MGSSHKIDIGGLLGGGRQYLLVERNVRLEPFEGVTFPAPARVRLQIRGVNGFLEIAGEIDVEAHGECDRCLAGVVLPMHLGVEERIEGAGTAGFDPFGENNVLTGDRLDVADLATQLVCAAVPLGVLCSPQCLGLCAFCGEDKNSGTCACTSEQLVNGDGKWPT